MSDVQESQPGYENGTVRDEHNVNDAVVGVGYDAPGGSESPASSDSSGAQPSDKFDPSEHTVEEVLEHIKANPDDERRVLRAERRGQGRVGIVGHPEEG
jgi:hypothetical protein